MLIVSIVFPLTIIQAKVFFDYLKKIGLEERLYTTGNPTKEFLLNVDYTKAREKMKEFREESLDFLKNALG